MNRNEIEKVEGFVGYNLITIDELIAELQEIRKEKGNLEVRVQARDEGGTYHGLLAANEYIYTTKTDTVYYKTKYTREDGSEGVCYNTGYLDDDETFEVVVL